MAISERGEDQIYLKGVQFLPALSRKTQASKEA